MTSTRLRRTFNYPTESEDEDAVEEGMDEKDQENLIQNLTQKDTRSTRLYTSLLLMFPLLPALLYIPSLFKTSTVLPSTLAVTSLLATAYTLYFLPLPPVRIRVSTLSEADKRPDRTTTTTTTARRRAIQRSATGFSSAPPPAHVTPHVPYISKEVADQVGEYIVPVNGVLCALSTGWELWQNRAWSEGITVGGGYLPVLVWVVIMWARRELRTVDLGELERLRYQGKST